VATVDAIGNGMCGTGYWILDTGHWMLDAGYWTAATPGASPINSLLQKPTAMSLPV